MRVEHDVKLTFDDVLIRPKRSTLVSRSDVTLVREFNFRHSDTPLGPEFQLLPQTWILQEFSEYPEFSRTTGC